MDLIARVIGLLVRGETICLVTIVVSDNADIPTGRKAIVLVDGTMEWGTGLVHLDSTLRVLALKALSDRKKRTVEIEDRMRVFFDLLPAEAKLLVAAQAT